MAEGGGGRRSKRTPLGRSCGGEVEKGTRARCRALSGDGGGTGMEARRGEGTNLLRKQIRSLNKPDYAEYGNRPLFNVNEFSEEYKQNSRAGGISVKMLIKEEMETHMQVKSTQNAPGIIARLMGLETLPSQPQHKKKAQPNKWPQNISMGFKGKHISCEDTPLRTSVKDQLDFKDVFEVSETSKPEEHHNTSIGKGWSKQNTSEKGISDIWQTFLDAKRLSTDEDHQNSAEFSEAVEVLDSNKNIFLELLEEPDFLFTKQLQDLRSMRSNSQPSRITVLKSSDVSMSERSEIYSESGRKGKGHIHRRKCDKYSYHDNESDLVSHSIKEHSISNSRESKCQRQPERCTLPTRIVVLKPNLEKYHNSEESTPSPISSNKSQPGYRKKEFQSYRTHTLSSEVRDRQRYYVSRNKRKGSREIAREIAENMRHRRRASFSAWNSGYDDIFCYGSPSNMSEKETMDIEALSRISGHLDDLDSSYSDSSVQLFESSVSWETRKHLSNRCVNSQPRQFQNVGSSGQVASTLGGMLAISDREVPNTTFINESQNRCDGPSGTSSNDGLKDRCLRNLSRSKSLPVAVVGNSYSSGMIEVCCREDHGMPRSISYLHTHESSDQTSFNQLNSSKRKSSTGRKKSLPVNFLGEEIEPVVNERHVDSKRWNDHDLSKDRDVVSEPSMSHLYGLTTSVNNVCAPKNEHSEASFECDEDELQTSDPTIKCPVDGDLVVNHRKNMISKEMPRDEHEALSFNLHSPIREMELSNASRSTPMSSPDSILELPGEDVSSSPECFERVSAELQGLRLQLQLLRLQSSGAYAEGSEILSDDDSGRDRDISVRTLDSSCILHDEDDMEFWYVHDMLNDSNLDVIPSAWYLPDAPVGPVVFQNLEKIYNKQPAWTRAERKLLFDLANSFLSDVLAQSMDPHRCVRSTRREELMEGGKVLAEDIWQLLVRRRKELSCGDPEEIILDVGWLGMGDSFDAVGRELENMLKDDLLDELVCELIVRRAR